MSNIFLISIIVPVFNVEKYLDKCIKSIISQTYKNLEVILVDDGSIDGSGYLCDIYGEKDARVKVIHKNNEGVAKARLIGFKMSSGDYITFVDGDDYISLNYIEKLIDPIIRYKVDLVCCNHYNQYGDKIYPSNYIASGYFDKSKILCFISTEYLYDERLGYSGVPIFLVTKLIKREYVSNGLLAGKELWWGEDQIASFQILMSVNSMFIVNEPLYYYVKHDGQVTSIYKSSLWLNQLRSYLLYKAIDKNNLLKSQLIKHIWKYTVLVNLYRKMPVEIHSLSDFINEMLRIEKMDGWKEFFNNKKIGLGRRNNLIFWLIKLRMYRLLYLVFLKKVYEPAKLRH